MRIGPHRALVFVALLLLGPLTAHGPAEEAAALFAVDRSGPVGPAAAGGMPSALEISQPEEVLIEPEAVWEGPDDGPAFSTDDGAPLAARPARPGLVIGGAEWLYARPSMSEAVAFVGSSFEGQDLSQTRSEYDFSYDSSVRTFVGYRRCDCGSQLLFTYARWTGDATAETPAATTSTVYTGPLEINTSLGQSLVSSAEVEINTYDIDFAKAVDLAGGHAATCGDPACGTCPRWDLIWSAGVRIADVDLDYGGMIRDVEGQLASSGLTAISFRGAGPRLGILGKRSFGRAGCCSLFAKGNVALLLGDYDVASQRFVTQPNTSHQSEVASLTRVIPVTEIEVGGTYCLGSHASLAAGYLFHAWHDLGMTQGIGGNLPSFDTANILSFDGLFVRGEWSY